MKFVVAVPARLESTRLPRKVLADIGGVPMLRRVLERSACSRRVTEVVLCTDSEEVSSLASTWGFRVLLTSPECTSGSERIASVVTDLMADVIINVQGDQPFVDPGVIDSMCAVFEERTPTPAVVTPVYRLPMDKLDNPDVVKVVVGARQRALYFSRAAIPFVRGEDLSRWHERAVHWGHIGMYGYRHDVLCEWGRMTASALEDAEKLEQLRVLDHGIAIDTFEVESRPEHTLSVDSQLDLDNARALARSID